MKLPTLYARSELGKVLEWTIEVNGDQYRTIAGARDAKQVTSEWTTCKPKSAGRSNATTGSEQALLEAKSHWKKKLKSRGYWENEKDIDGTRYFEFMLALKFDDHKKKLSWPVMVDRKYNGMRQGTSIDGPITRGGEKVISAPHIFEALKPIFTQHPHLQLDGELYNHEYRYKLNELMKIVRKTKPEEITPELLAKSEKMVRYYVYDGYGMSCADGPSHSVTETIPCSARREALKVLLKDVPYIVVVPYSWADNEAEVMKLYEEYIADGYEGAIVRNDVAYRHRRTPDLLKVKPEDDSEHEILDILEGTGNWSGYAKVAILKYGDKTFRATFKGSMESGAKILKERERWIGKVVTVSYFGLTGLGTPHAARIDPDNCFKGDR